MAMTIEIIIFFILQIVGIYSCVIVVREKNMFHTVLFFGLFLLSLAGLYLLLIADFLAMVQIFGYVGGIVVLILFVVMLTRKIIEAEAKIAIGKRLLSFVVSLLFWGPILYLYRRTFFPSKGALYSIAEDLTHRYSTPTIGKMLLSSHIIPFEIVGIVLLVAIVGALAIVREGTPE